MAYYWVTEAQLYLQSLGFGGANGDLPAVNAESQDIRINQYGGDNSFSVRTRSDLLRSARAAWTTPRTPR